MNEDIQAATAFEVLEVEGNSVCSPESRATLEERIQRLRQAPNSRQVFTVDDVLYKELPMNFMRLRHVGGMPKRTFGRITIDSGTQAFGLGFYSCSFGIADTSTEDKPRITSIGIVTPRAIGPGDPLELRIEAFCGKYPAERIGNENINEAARRLKSLTQTPNSRLICNLLMDAASLHEKFLSAKPAHINSGTPVWY